MMRINPNKKRNFRLAYIFGLFIMCSFSITGCISHFAQPLTPPGAQKLDSTVFGTWFWNKDNESGYIHLGEDKAPGFLKVAMVEFDDQNKMKVSQWSGHTSVFGDTRYLNLRWIYPEEEKHDGYLILKYEIKEQQFGLYFIKDKLIIKAVKEGKLDGKIVKTASTSAAWVTQDQDKLVKYILDNHNTLFTDLTLFPKLKLP